MGRTITRLQVIVEPNVMRRGRGKPRPYRIGRLERPQWLMSR